MPPILIQLTAALMLLAGVQSTPPPDAPREAGQTTQSLFELARRERARREAIRQPVRLITNDDLRGLSEARVTTSINASGWSRLPQRVEIDARPSEDEEIDRAALEAGFAAARVAYQSEVNNNLVLQLRLNSLRNAFVTEDDGSRQGLIQAQLQESLAQLQDSEVRIAEARQAIAELERKAAAAGLLPGEIKKLVGDLQAPSSLLPETNPNP